MKSVANHILMIRPSRFGFNDETSKDNSFQTIPEDDPKQIHEKALKEFDNFLHTLKSHGVSVTEFQEPAEPITPDSIFPNNWFSTHFENHGTVILYPMLSKSRQFEREKGALDLIKSKFYVNEIVDLSHFENQKMYLEGTGSVILDRAKKMAYACLSERTNETVFETLCQKLGYHGVLFKAYDFNNKAIYHTNVMMMVADNYAIVCLDAVQSPMERANLLIALRHTGKTVITFNLAQMKSFAGNMIQIRNSDDVLYLIMSSKAHRSLTKNQLESIKQFNEIISVDIPTIEKVGGGSARCMIAEIFLDAKSK